jgi:hypothetical protein
MLITNMPVDDFKQAEEKIQLYRLRWQIETFHKVLKSGCRVEDCRLETLARLKKYIALKSVIAWRLFWLTHVGREIPEVSCQVVLAEHEWKALYCKINKTRKPPSKPPTAYQTMRWIAQLGGFLARKSDGEPGVMTMWRGWVRLTDVADDWLLFQSGAKIYG